MRLYAIAAIVGILALGAGWYTHVIHLADEAKGYKQALADTQKELSDLTETNRALQADHEARASELADNLGKLKADDDCSHHVLNWGKSE